MGMQRNERIIFFLGLVILLDKFLTPENFIQTFIFFICIFCMTLVTFFSYQEEKRPKEKQTILFWFLIFSFFTIIAIGKITVTIISLST